MKHYKNNPDPALMEGALKPELFTEAYESISRWPDYKPTPLVELDALAADLGINKLYYKDEGKRFNLKSFKALGGAYAVVRILKDHLSLKLNNTTITEEDILNRKYADYLTNFTVVTATDGNHGRSVAWGAHQCGIKCMIYMHKGVSASRAIAIELLGATVVWVDGNYDDSLSMVKRHAIENQWYIISDTSYDGYIYAPKFVMAGYSVMTREISEQLKGQEPPTHIIIQGGVGGLAGAVCLHSKLIWQDKRPRFVIVEPETADCLYQSAKEGSPTMVHISKETMMGGLSCGEVSLIAWKILKPGADDFTTINDELVAPAMRLLNRGLGNDPKIIAGESGVAGLALMMEIKNNPEMKAALGLDHNSRVLLFGTEGDTDPEIYQQIISESA